MARKGRDDGYARLSVRAYAASLRSFLRYAESRGWCTRGLAALVASPRVYQHENLPVGPSWSDVQRLVATTEGSRPKDIRDRAILLLLAVYAREVRALRLEDLDWEKGLLFVARTKGRKREPARTISPLSHRSAKPSSAISEKRAALSLRIEKSSDR